MQRIAWVNGLFPPEFVDSGRAETGLLLADNVPGDDGHRHRRRMPPARGHSPKVRLGGLLIGEMEGLGVVLPGELQHFLARDVVGAEVRLGADHQILEIDHGSGA